MLLFYCIALGMYIGIIPMLMVVAYFEMDAGPIKHERLTEFLVWLISTVSFTAIFYFNLSPME